MVGRNLLCRTYKINPLRVQQWILLCIFVPVRGYLYTLCNVFTPERACILTLMEIGLYIRNKRKQLHLSQIELSERTGVGIRFIRELERGKPTVQLDKVNQVLYLFGEELQPAKIEMT